MPLKVNRGKIDWTPEFVARLRYLWDQGIPAAQIAKLFDNGATKNSIIGKAHRLGLALRTKPWPRTPHGVRRSSPNYRKKKPRPIAAKAPPSASLPLPVPETPPPPKTPPAPPPPPPKPIPPRHKPGTFTLMDLRPHECHWPVNSPPRGGLYLFCGSPVAVGQYCREHHGIGFVGTKRQASTAGWQPRQAGF